jgi:hypothetical protein
MIASLLLVGKGKTLFYKLSEQPQARQDAKHWRRSFIFLSAIFFLQASVTEHSSQPSGNLTPSAHFHLKTVSCVVQGSFSFRAPIE